MEDKDECAGSHRYGHDLERSDSHHRLVKAVSSTYRAQSPRSTLLRGTGIGAIVGAAASRVWYIIYDGMMTLSQSPETSPTSPKDFTSRMFGYSATLSEKPRETAWLDGMRGVAAFFVMALHFNFAWIGVTLEAPYGALFIESWEIWRLPFIRLLFCSGHAQVCVFFILSGFVLSWSPLASIRLGRHDKVNQVLASSVFRRWIRLYGTCFVIGSWAVVEFRLGVLDVPVSRKATFLGQLWDYVLKFEPFANPLHLEREGWEWVQIYAWVMWTIPLEFAGSMLVFMTLLGVSRVRRYSRRSIVIAGVAAYSCVTARWTYWLFAYGMLLADYVREAGSFEALSKRVESKIAYRMLCYTSMMVGLYFAGIPIPTGQYWTTGYDTILSLTPNNYRHIEGGARYWWSWAGIMCVTSACHMTMVRKFFMLPFNQYLGRISFMLYLTHVYILECLSYSFRQTMYESFGWVELKTEKEIKVWVAGPFTTVMIFVVLWTVLGSISLFVAHWCQVLVDEPCIRFAKWVESQFVKEPRESEVEAEKTTLPI